MVYMPIIAHFLLSLKKNLLVMHGCKVRACSHRFVLRQEIVSYAHPFRFAAVFGA